MTFFVYLTVTALTAVFSYLHGRDAVSKGWLVAGEALAGGLAGVLLAGWFGLLGVLISPIYWFLFRTSNQARAELDYMARHSWGKLVKVWQAYILPITFCNVLILIGSIYAQAWLHLALIPLCIASVGLVIITAKHFRNDPGERAGDNRQMVEIANGICGGINVSSVLAVLVKAVEYAG